MDALPINYAAIPTDLIVRPQWIVWRYEERKGQEKPTKVLYTPGAGRAHAKSNTASTWRTFDEARTALENPGDLRFDGIGYVTTAADGIVGIDLDKCRDPETGELTPYAAKVVKALRSYTEITPSGRGLRIYVRGEIPGPCKTDPIEIYSTVRYFTVTGNILHPSLATVQTPEAETLAAVYAEAETYRKSKPATKPKPRTATAPPAPPRRIELIRQFVTDQEPDLWTGNWSPRYGSQSEADLALAAAIAYYAGPDGGATIDDLMTESGLYRPKWDREDYKTSTIAQALNRDKFYPWRENGQPSPAPAKTTKADKPAEAPFWFEVEQKSKEGEITHEVKIHHGRFLDGLTDRGFAKFYPHQSPTSVFVLRQNNVIEEQSAEQIKDEHLRRIKTLPRKVGNVTRDQIRTALIRGANVYFSRPILEFLPPIEPEFKRATPHAAFFFYRNVWVEVRSDCIIPRPYSDLDAHIWRHQITQRDFSPLPGFEPEESEFGRFVVNVTGGSSIRYDALTTSLGYLLHPFKDPANARAVVFVDETVSDSPAGRTGKSLTGKALSYLVPVADIDGKNFRFDSPFAFQAITLGTQLANFNDVTARFPFERLFSVITGDMQIEQKNRDRWTMPFKESPKFLLSTNYVIEGDGPSHRARIFEVEFSDHYSDRHTPYQEFGHRLFDDWTGEEWLRFDHFLLRCVSDYLRHGLVKYDHVTLTKRKVMQQTDADFARWIFPEPDESRPAPILPNRIHVKGDLLTNFNTYAEREEAISAKQLVAWLKKYADLAELAVEQDVIRDFDGKQQRVITFKGRS